MLNSFFYYSVVSKKKHVIITFLIILRRNFIDVESSTETKYCNFEKGYEVPKRERQEGLDKGERNNNEKGIREGRREKIAKEKDEKNG